MNSKEFAEKIAKIILTKKGYDIKILELSKLTTIADYFVICSADSDVQVKAIADEVDKKLRDEGIKSSVKEGYEALNWILLDYFDVIVHVFKAESRIYYNLEKFWADAPIFEVEES